MQIPAYNLWTQAVLGKELLLPKADSWNSSKIEHYYAYAASQLISMSAIYLLSIWRYSRYVMLPGFVIAPIIEGWNASHLIKLDRLKQTYIDPYFSPSNKN